MANPYAITPANPLQALMMGVQGYEQGQKSQQAQALQEAGQLYASGDIKGAQAAAARGGSLQALMGFAGLQNQDRQFGLQQEQFGETKRHAQATEGLTAKQLAQTGAFQQGQLGISQGQLGVSQAQLVESRRQHDLTAQQPFKLGTDSVGNDVYGVRDLKGGYRILDPNALPGAGGSGAPASGGPAVAPAVGGPPAPQAGVTPATIAPLPFKPTDSEKTTLSKTTTAYSVLDKELERYGNLIKENGVSFLPGTEARTSYDTARRNIQLQMKELYNLGVLNGPDLGLMNQMLVDPTTGVRPEATVSQAMLDSASAPVRALYKSFTLQGQANTNITDLRNSMKNIYEANRDVILRRRPAQPAPAPQAATGAAPQANPGVVPWQQYFGTK